MSVVLGIDPSSRKIAFFSLGTDGYSHTHVVQVPTKVKNRAVLCAQIYTECYEYFELLDKSIPVFIEQPLMGRSAHATIVQAQSNGVVQAAATLAGMERVYEVNVRSWKREVIGRGNADKAYIHSWLRSHHPSLADNAGDDQDLTDAAAVALYGQGCIARGDVIRSGVLD